MKAEFPQFFRDPRADVRRYTAMSLLFVVLSCGFIVFELISYLVVGNEVVTNKLKVERYESLVNQSQKLSVLEEKYAESVAQMETVSSALGTHRSLGQILSAIEQSIDPNSVVERMVFDAGKSHALVYVKSVYPRELESSITSGDNEKDLRFSILSKKTANQAPFKVLYELRASL
ncbi:hypothetical protein JF541_18940 [Marinobacter hydrocarbonoclasticus]|uniref:hypothetical protein n=1 Tax=Marinobacter nauticus TaxID=2743 RepID=UPI001A8FE0AE|nr:hypothetical protein [Marinobacter nauticus]MBN8241237.1 hypothetical protein [Marinobacter nauticus]